MAEEEIPFVPVDQLMDTLHTSLLGLSSEEVATRRASYGPDAVVPAELFRSPPCYVDFFVYSTHFKDMPMRN